MPDILNPYRSGGSALHRLDARVKLILALMGILAIAALPIGAWPVFTLLLCGVLALVVLSELGLAFVLRRSLIAFPFALAALPLLFVTAGPPLLSFRLSRWTLTLTATGLERFLFIAGKSWLSVQLAILLTATTPFADLLVAMRAIRVPRLLVVIFALMWRYLFLFVHEAARLRIARDARSAHVSADSGGTLAWRARVTGNLVGNLFLRGYERSERVYHAMLARGYDGEIRTLGTAPLSGRERRVLALGILLLGGVLLLGLFLG